MTASAIAPPSTQGPPPLPLTATVRGRHYVVVAVGGDDVLSRRLVAAGLWPGAVFERLGRAPLGDPLLVRVHGYRLALRVREAERVLVAEARE